MLIRAGYEIVYSFPQPTPLILMLNIHYSRASDLVRPELLYTEPAVPTSAGCGSAPMRSSTTRGCRNPRPTARPSTLCRICRRKHSCTCCRAVTASATC